MLTKQDSILAVARVYITRRLSRLVRAVKRARTQIKSIAAGFAILILSLKVVSGDYVPNVPNVKNVPNVSMALKHNCYCFQPEDISELPRGAHVSLFYSVEHHCCYFCSGFFIQQNPTKQKNLCIWAIGSSNLEHSGLQDIPDIVSAYLKNTTTRQNAASFNFDELAYSIYQPGCRHDSKPVISFTLLIKFDWFGR